MNELLTSKLRANFALLAMRTAEEGRAEHALVQAAVGLGRDLYRWSITRGLERFGGGGWAPVPAEKGDPGVAALALSGADIGGEVRLGRHGTADSPVGRPAVLILADCSPYLRDPVVVRRIRDALPSAREHMITGILLGPTLELPADLRADVSDVDFELPAAAELERLVVSTCEANPGKATMPDTEAMGRLIDAARGLTLQQAEDALALSLVTRGQLAADVVADEKAAAVKASGALEILRAPAAGLASVGGLEAVKRWISTRGRAFTPEAAAFGLPNPKGALLVGVQGCGKSLAAKAAASALGLPLVRLDVGALFGGLVGESEANVRQALKTLDAVAPCVCMIDELEKAFAGSGAGRSHDGGTSSRVLGHFLTWTQEHASPVFLIATANDVTALPPELIRRGRWDAMMFVDLPDLAEREAIIRIHIAAKRRDHGAFDVPRLAAAAAGFSGAEIEQVVVDGLFEAFADGEDITTARLLTAIESTVPLSRTMAEPISALREWARTRCVPANGRIEQVPQLTAGRRVA